MPILTTHSARLQAIARSFSLGGDNCACGRWPSGDEQNGNLQFRQKFSFRPRRYLSKSVRVKTAFLYQQNGA
jgi:hypothetical protein